MSELRPHAPAGRTLLLQAPGLRITPVSAIRIQLPRDVARQARHVRVSPYAVDGAGGV
ncbi:MAG: hypothetical protein NT143_08585 [Actinobacteria bacterium]|nr:hypothetical protein [Actinomycetota bacterium]